MSATVRKRATPRKALRDAEVVGTASLRYLRAPAQKTRLVVDEIRGKRVDEALAFLRHCRRSVAVDILKLLRSAVANTENGPRGSMVDPEELFVTRALVDEGPVLKRIRPQPMGRAFPILKRHCHVRLELGTPRRGGTAAAAQESH